MRLEIKDIIDKHKGMPAAIAAHGPSLNLFKEQIASLHQQEKLIRFSVNNWWDYFDTPPNYWILSTTVFTLDILMRTWYTDQTKNILEETGVPVFYSDDGDFTPKELIHQNLKTDWLAYDQRHWEGKNCIEILDSFNKHCEEHENYCFNRYGNNEIMWHPPRCFTNSGHALDGKCCQQNIPARSTIQEELQALSGFNQHYSTGDTVSFHAIAFAILMGCNPIYVSGMDLDYNKGYANPDKTDWKHKASGPNDWSPVRQNLENDIYVLDESAKKRGIEIISLTPDAWYDGFTKSQSINL